MGCAYDTDRRERDALREKERARETNPERRRRRRRRRREERMRSNIRERCTGNVDPSTHRDVNSRGGGREREEKRRRGR